MVLILLMAGLCLLSAVGIQRTLPKIAGRIETPAVFLLLLLAAMSSFVVQSMAVYLRSFKREPYLVQSIAVAGLTMAGILFAAPRWGSAAVAILNFGFSGILGLLWAGAIFRTTRNVLFERPCYREAKPPSSSSKAAVYSGDLNGF
jgi:cytochrome bd-type quinol oxidase subunit 1